MRFDRHEQLSLFIPQVNSLGPAAGRRAHPGNPPGAPHVPAHHGRDHRPTAGRRDRAGHPAQARGPPRGSQRHDLWLRDRDSREWAAEFEHELQDAVAARLVGMWSVQDTSALRLAGAGAQRFRDELGQVDTAMANEVKVGDERTLRANCCGGTASARCAWGTINHCLGIPEQAACLQDLPADVASDGVSCLNRCHPRTCRNSVVTDEHAPIWIAEERDLLRKLGDRKMSPHNREQLQTELTEVQQITRRFPDAADEGQQSGSERQAARRHGTVARGHRRRYRRTPDQGEPLPRGGRQPRDHEPRADHP